MGYEIYLSPAALADIRIAVDFYNSKLDGLGKRMSLEIDSTLQRIAMFPASYSKRYQNKRAAKLPSFPFLIFYRIEERDRSIQVLRAFHTSQRPFWSG